MFDSFLGNVAQTPGCLRRPTAPRAEGPSNGLTNGTGQTVTGETGIVAVTSSMVATAAISSIEITGTKG